ncbi:MAG: hypothetical protein L0229_28470, partial [Blastocatellia bacterium]|nr:hypothetical protein [Blastocatellia bacterium]
MNTCGKGHRFVSGSAGIYNLILQQNCCTDAGERVSKPTSKIVTQLLVDWSGGSQSALDQLMP